MNLVKLQDDLKMLPMAALQSKAQGQDPSVPPWLATSVLNERMDAQKKAGLAQGAKENQPSIAEQLTQKAGLMALQGQQQKQAQQQMMQQMAQAPQPAPEGVPQPDMQPQEEQMMAQGGLARLPVNPRMFDYRAGGIIRFANEGDVPESDEDKEKKQTEADRAAIAQLLKSIKGGSEYAGRAIADIASIIPRGLVGAYDTAVVRPMKAAGINASYLSPMLTPKGANADSATPFTDIARKRDAAATVQQGPSTTPEAEDMGARDRGLTSIAPKTAPPVAPQPAPQPGTVQRSYPTASSQNNQPADQAQQPARTGLASLQPVDALAEAQRFTTAMPSQKEPTLNDTRALRQQALRDAGLPEDVGATLKEGVGRYEAESDRIRKERKYADAIYALSAETGGLGGIAQRSAERAQINATADAIRNDKANEMRTAMEAARRAEAMGDVAEVRRQMDLYNKANEEKGKAMVTAATNISNQQTQTQGSLEGERLRNVSAEKIAAARDITDRRGQDLHLQASQLMALIGEGRLTRDLEKQKLAEMNALQKNIETELLKPDDMALPAPEREAAKQRKAILRQDLDGIRAGIAKLGGNVTLQSGTPTMNADRAAQFKVIR